MEPETDYTGIDGIKNGNFENDYSYITKRENADEEYLIFIIHGIGQNSQKLRNSIHKKIKPTVEMLYKNKGKLFNKTLHFRIIDWKTRLIKKTEENISVLIDKHSETSGSKSFINQVPLDILYYLNLNNKYEIINDVVDQMNFYYNNVNNYRELFRGNVSIIAHSLGSVISYDILKSMKKYINSPIKRLFTHIEHKNNNSTFDEFEADNVSYGIYSSDPLIFPLNFSVDHLFILGSPLSLFVKVNQSHEAFLEEMQTVKDFHNIIHPMDPVAYRIEPIIYNYPETPYSFLLPHWETDGKKNGFFDNLFEILCYASRKKPNYDTHDYKIGRKRYDFIVQENSTEKAINLVGVIFAHMNYWCNPDVFYYIIKCVHWQLSDS
jgi:phospholipase DDHD1